MKEYKYSTTDLTMAASQTFESLIDQVKNSNLNFHLQQSPFSAVISIKKSYIKDKSGVPLMSNAPDPAGLYCLKSENQETKERVKHLEK